MPGKRGAKFHLNELNFLLDNIKNVMEDPRDLVECFEGVAQVEGLVGDWGQVLGGQTTAKVVSFVNHELWQIMWLFCDM
jgi:hypothetical protein